MTFGKKLQKLRIDAGMSQEDLAFRLDVSRQAVSKWELDKTVPDVKYIVAISDLFQVSTDYLLKKNAATPCTSSEFQTDSSGVSCSQPQEEPSSAPGDPFHVKVVCATALMLAADLVFAAAHIFYMRELYTFCMIFLLLAMIFLPVLLAGWRAYLRTTVSRVNCRQIVSAGTRLWFFGLMLLCGFHQVIHDVFISPGIFAFLDDIDFLILTFLAVTLGLWAAGRLSALLFPKNTNR